MKAGHLPHLLFVHGGPGFDEYLRQSFESATSSVGFEPHFYQQLKRVSIDALVEQLAREVQNVPSKNVVLVAHSWGVALAIETLKQKLVHNKKILGLVLIDGFVSADMDRAFAHRLEELELTDKYSMEDIFLSKRDREAPWAMEYLQKIMAKLDNESLDRIFKEYIGTLDLRLFVKTLMMPTLVVFGSEDVRVPPSYQRGYAALLPKVEILEIEGAGHFPFLQKNDLSALANRIKQFCESLPIPASAS